MTLTLADMERIGDTPQWKYGAVTCNSPSGNNITSIILSMINNQIASNSSGITITREITSSGNNPRTVLYLFTPALTPAQVATFIEGIMFTQTNEISGVNPYVNISVDANPTRLPDGAPTITVWDKHPDGSPHYYVWVNTGYYIGYMQAYNAAKSYYFQGMRGYLPTITSLDENALLTNISTLGGWSGGVRTTDAISDPQSLTKQPTSIGPNFKWLCGPERGFEYYKGPKWNTSGAGPLGGAYSGWPPGGGQPDGQDGGENSMQINFGGYWNDLPTAENAHLPSVLTGYFIEFGGNGKSYTSGATYGANTDYNTPNAPTTNAQWEGYSPGNTASTTTTFKPNSMRANVLVIE